MSYHETDSQENVAAQLWIALGRGMGETMVSAAAVDAAAETYSSMLPEMTAGWAELGPELLDYARVLGQRAAEAASAAGSDVIEKQHWEEALQAMGWDDDRPCPCRFPSLT